MMPRTQPRVVQWISSEVFLSLYLPAFTLGLGTGIAAPALPVYAKSFDIPFGMASWVIIIHLLGAAISTIPTGMMIDKVGRRKIVLAGPILTAISSLLIPFTSSFPELLALRFINGWAQGMWVLGRLTIIADQGNEKRGRLITGMVGVDSAGKLIGPALGGLIATVSSVTTPFLVHGMLALLAVLPSFKLIQEARPSTSAARKADEGGGFAWLREVLVLPIIILCIVQVFVQMSRSSSHNGILDLYAVYAYGVGPGMLGIMAAVATAVSLPITFLAGHIMDRFGRKKTIVPGFTLVGLSMVLMALVAVSGVPFHFYFVALVFVHIAQAVTHGSMQTLASDVAPAKARGKFFGLWKLVGETSTFISPVMFTFFSDHGGFPTSFVYLACSGFAAAGITAFFVKETLGRKDAVEHGIAVVSPEARAPVTARTG